ncbi:MAG: L-threonylcarbamoyladenylate synthase [Chroococcidiopsidaceae cyanobacterium CP_BM_ER_R8_30]|nr:L-threonylcarbamoyladenylate synthase [Chroococcidiopsidaceae cyanobacterium CP_BM_ER_R8_30]
MTQVTLEALIAGANAGCLISFPTDTVPALAVRPNRADLIFAAKRRSQSKPLILMAATPAELWSFTFGSADEQLIWQQVAQAYWPGALTLVLPASELVPSAMNPSDPKTIGLRVPSHTVARSILSRTGPLATTSANLSGQQPLLTMAEIAAQFPDVLIPSRELVAVESGIGIPSTVVKWVGCRWEVLRQGAVKLEYGVE